MKATLETSTARTLEGFLAVLVVTSRLLLVRYELSNLVARIQRFGLPSIASGPDGPQSASRPTLTPRPPCVDAQIRNIPRL